VSGRRGLDGRGLPGFTVPGFDVFDDCGAFVLEQAEREYRAGVCW